MKNFSNTNEAYECIMLLDEINNVIDTLCKLSDDGYYMDYIFNGGSLREELIEEAGFTKDYVEQSIDKFEKLRIALFGESIDWKGLVQHELRAVAEKERNKNIANEDRIKKLEYELNQIKKNEK